MKAVFLCAALVNFTANMSIAKKAVVTDATLFTVLYFAVAMVAAFDIDTTGIGAEFGASEETITESAGTGTGKVALFVVTDFAFVARVVIALINVDTIWKVANEPGRTGGSSAAEGNVGV